MGWKKSAVKLPFLAEVTQVLGVFRSGADALSAVLDAASKGLSVAQALYVSGRDPFSVLFGQLLTEVEALVRDTFDAGFYSLTVDPRKVSASRIRQINAAFPTSLSLDTSLSTEQINSQSAKQQAAGTDPVLTFNAMKVRAEYKRDNWKYDQFGIPLMTPNQCIQHMVASFDDEGDGNRPQFGTGAEVAAVGFIVSAPDLDKFIALAQPLLDVLDLEQLADIINSVKVKGRVGYSGFGGIAPDWESQAKISDFGFMKAQRDAILSVLAQVRAVADSGADRVVDRLLRSIQSKVQSLNDVTQEFSNLLGQLSSALDAQGIYVFTADGIGGNTFLKQELRTYQSSAANMSKDTTGYTFGFLLVGAGPSLASVRTISDLLTAARALKIVGGSNAKQKVEFSAPPASGTIGVGGFPIVPYGDPAIVRKAIQDALAASGLGTECLVLMSTKSKAEEQVGGVDGYNALPSILAGEKDGLGFVVEFQGADGRTPQPLLNFSDPGLDTIYELCFSEVPTSGYFTLVLNGKETQPISYNSTAVEVQEIINDTEGVYNTCSVSGSFAACFTLTFRLRAVTVVVGANTLIGPSGPVSISLVLLQAGRDPANFILDADGRPIQITVTELVPGRRNDLCD